MKPLRALERLQRFREDEELLSQLEGLSKGTRPELAGSVRRYQASIRSLEKELQEMRYRLAQDRVGKLLHSARRVNDVKVLTSVVDRLDNASLRNLADELKSRIGRGVVVLATSGSGKVSLVAAITSDLTSRVSTPAEWSRKSPRWSAAAAAEDRTWPKPEARTRANFPWRWRRLPATSRSMSKGRVEPVHFSIVPVNSQGRGWPRRHR